MLRLYNHSLSLYCSHTIAPSGVPLSVRITVLSSDSARIRWRAVNCLDANGMIEQYTVSYTASDTGSVITSATTTNTMLTVTGLQAGLEYSFQVAAENAVGMGPFSEPIIVDFTGKSIIVIKHYIPQASNEYEPLVGYLCDCCDCCFMKSLG